METQLGRMSLDGASTDRHFSTPNVSQMHNTEQLNRGSHQDGQVHSYSTISQSIPNPGGQKLPSDMSNNRQFTQLGTQNHLKNYNAPNLSHAYSGSQIPLQAPQYINQPATSQGVRTEYQGMQQMPPAFMPGQMVSPQNMIHPMYPQKLPVKTVTAPGMQSHVPPQQQPRRLDPDQMPNPIQVCFLLIHTHIIIYFLMLGYG